MAEVLINARAAARAQLSGVERWAVELSERLPALRPGVYAVARPPRALAYRAGQLWEQAVLPVAARRAGARLVLSPANLAPLAGRNAVVVHDAVALSHPEWFSRPYAAWQRVVLPAIVRRAEVVIAPSAFSRDEIAQRCGVDAAGIEVVGGGVDERFAAADARAVAAARAALGLRERRYVLAVAGESPRKNFAALPAVARALAPLGVEVVTAGSRRAHHGTLADHEAVQPLGYVDDALLPGLYAGAEAFVLPTRHEGFGLTCLEAMAAGVPVVAGARGALPEVLGEDALLVDPEDHAALADATRAAVEDGSLRTRLRSAGRARAARRTWDRTVEAVDAVVTAAPSTF